MVIWNSFHTISDDILLTSTNCVWMGSRREKHEGIDSKVSKCRGPLIGILEFQMMFHMLYNYSKGFNRLWNIHFPMVLQKNISICRIPIRVLTAWLLFSVSSKSFVSVTAGKTIWAEKSKAEKARLNLKFRCQGITANLPILTYKREFGAQQWLFPLAVVKLLPITSTFSSQICIFFPSYNEQK